jgi:hypothetical protein
MSDETREAFFLGTEARINKDMTCPYAVDDGLSYYWHKGRLGMQYRNQEARTLQDMNHDLRQKMASIKAKNAVPADEFNTAKMNKAIDELCFVKMKLSVADSTIATMQATINNLSAKLGKVAKAEKREANKVRL